MSRRKREQSNTTHIGIFSDKSARYNLAILETLYQRGATAWQIAENLQRKINPSENKEVRFYRSQKIYSVIQRKKGRLNDLRDKGYIEEKEGIWELTTKGITALNIEKPDLVINELQAHKNQVLEQFKQKTSTMSGTLKEPFGIQIDLSQMRDGLGKTLNYLLEDPAFFSTFIEEAKASISEGVDLDRIDGDTFLTLVLHRKQLKPFLEKARKNR